jgi:predicted HNH restriction endonuclease
MRFNWKLWFSVGDVLETEFRGSQFRIEEFKKNSITVRLLERKDQPTVELQLARLDALAGARKSVKDAQRNIKFTDAVNAAWEGARVGEDRQNESQYWAVVCERVRRRKRALRGETVFREGRRVLYTLSRAERNPRLRKACIKKHGTRCKACNFDFEKRYGEIGKGYIHIHHLKPMANAAAARDVSVDDLVPVCANCHAMLHQRTPPLTPDQLRAMMKGNNQ